MGGCASAPKEKELPHKSKVHHQVSQTLSPPKNISSPNLIARGNEVGKTTFLASSLEKTSAPAPTENSKVKNLSLPSESVQRDALDQEFGDGKVSGQSSFERKTSFSSSPLDGTWVLNSSREGKMVPYSPREAALYSPNQYSSHSGFSKDDNFSSTPRRAVGSGPDHLLLAPIDVFPERDPQPDDEKFLSPTVPEDENTWLQDADQDDMFLDDAEEGLEEDEMNKMVGSAVQTLRNSKPHKSYNEGAVSAVVLGRIAEEREQDLESNDTDLSAEFQKQESPADHSPINPSVPVPPPAAAIPKRRVINRGVRSRSMSWGGEQDSVSLSSSSLSSVGSGRPKNVNRGGSLEEPTAKTDYSSSESNSNAPKSNFSPKVPDSQASNAASESVQPAVPIPSKRIPTGRKSHARSNTWTGDVSELAYAHKNTSAPSSASSTLPVVSPGASSASSSSSALPPSPTLPLHSPTFASENPSLPHTPPSNKIPPLPPIQASPSSRPSHSRLRNNSWAGIIEDFSPSEPLASNKVAAQVSSAPPARNAETEKRGRLPQLSVSVPSKAVPKMRVRSGSWGGVMDGGALSPHLSPIPVSRTKETVEPSIPPIPENDFENSPDSTVAPAKPNAPSHARRKTWGGEADFLHGLEAPSKADAKSQNSTVDDGNPHLDGLVSTRAIVA